MIQAPAAFESSQAKSCYGDLHQSPFVISDGYVTVSFTIKSVIKSSPTIGSLTTESETGEYVAPASR